MKFFKTAIATAALAVGTLAASPANAVLTYGHIPTVANNDFINLFLPGQQIDGWFGSQLFLTGPATITVQYFGAEAGFTNTFTYGGCVFTHTGGAGGATGTFSDQPAPGLGGSDSGREGQPDCSAGAQPAGLMLFNFMTPAGLDANGSNPDGSASDAFPNFFVSFDNPAYALDTTIGDGTANGGQSVFLFLDDTGGGFDDNHDDMVIRLTVACAAGVNCGFHIPEPGSLALVGLALFGAGVARRKMS